MSTYSDDKKQLWVHVHIYDASVLYFPARELHVKPGRASFLPEDWLDMSSYITQNTLWREGHIADDGTQEEFRRVGLVEERAAAMSMSMLMLALVHGVPGT